MVEKAKIMKFKCDILSDFQIMWLLSNGFFFICLQKIKRLPRIKQLATKPLRIPYMLLPSLVIRMVPLAIGKSTFTKRILLPPMRQHVKLLALVPIWNPQRSAISLSSKHHAFLVIFHAGKLPFWQTQLLWGNLLTSN